MQPRLLAAAVATSAVVLACGGSTAQPPAASPASAPAPSAHTPARSAAPGASVRLGEAWGQVKPRLPPLPPIPASPVPAPDELVATLRMAAPFAVLDDVGVLFDHVSPGMSTVVVKPDDVVEALLGLRHIDLSGVDLARPLRALLLDPSRFEQPVVLVVPVADEHALMALVSKHELQVQLHDGHAAIGSHDALTVVGGHALTMVAATPSPAAPIVDIDLERAARAGLRLRPWSVGPVAMVTGLFGAALESGERGRLVLDLEESRATVTLRITPRPGTALASFVAAQAPATFSQLERIGSADLTVGGHLEVGPLWDVVREPVQQYLRTLGGGTTLGAWIRWMEAPPGELGAAITLEAGGAMGGSVLLLPSDPALIRAILDAPRGKTEDEVAGAVTVSEKRERHRGHALHVVTSTVTGPLPPEEAQGMAVMGGNFTHATALVGGTVVVGLGTGAVDRARVLVELVTAKPKRRGPVSAPRAAVLAEARGRQESLLFTFDLTAIARLGGASTPPSKGEPVVLALGVDGGDLVFRLTAPADQLAVIEPLLWMP